MSVPDPDLSEVRPMPDPHSLPAARPTPGPDSMSAVQTTATPRLQSLIQLPPVCLTPAAALTPSILTLVPVCSLMQNDAVWLFSISHT